MRRKIPKTENKRSGIRIDRVLGGKSKRPLKTKLGAKVQECLSRWQKLDAEFFSPVNNYCIALKLFNPAFDEKFIIEPFVERNKVLLLGVYGREDELKRDRLLGYIVLYVGNPALCLYTFYAALSYSDKTNLGIKMPRLLYKDKSLLMFKFGIKDIDYLVGYREKSKETHDLENTSSSSMHTEMADAWKDGT